MAKPISNEKLEGIEYGDIVQYEFDPERQLILVEFYCRTEEKFNEMAIKITKCMENV